MNWLVAGSEIVAGLLLLVGSAAVIWLLRPQGTLQERLIVRFPGAWIVVGLSLTMLIATSVALIGVGVGILR